jgi:predicted RNA binding protein YcfA (HicA-like mRNA interferase family)
MGLKQIQTKIFLQYLKMLGIVEERQEASHSSFNYPKGHAKRMNRPMVIRTNE